MLHHFPTTADNNNNNNNNNRRSSLRKVEHDDASSATGSVLTLSSRGTSVKRGYTLLKKSNSVMSRIDYTKSVSSKSLMSLSKGSSHSSSSRGSNKRSSKDKVLEQIHDAISQQQEARMKLREKAHLAGKQVMKSQESDTVSELVTNALELKLRYYMEKVGTMDTQIADLEDLATRVEYEGDASGVAHYKACLITILERDNKPDQTNSGSSSR